MESRPRNFLIMAALLAGNAQAANLAADSLVCESPDQLDFVNRTAELKGQPASVVLKRAGLTVEFYKRQTEIALTIRLPRNQSPEANKANSLPYETLVGGCAAAGPAQAAILERKPISGIARIRTSFNGQPAELWTYSASLTE